MKILKRGQGNGAGFIKLRNVYKKTKVTTALVPNK